MRNRIYIAVALIIAICAPGFQNLTAQQITITVNPDDDQKEAFTGSRPSADMAILLDTSNSMDGLISQAKSQLWTIVQQFAKAKKAGKTPVLRVAVFEYGNTSLPASEGYIRQVVGLTDDLDKVSEALFALTTNGGDEYCGQVIDEALKRLDWNKEPNAYKAIFIAGNEPFTQGSVDYKDSCRKAIESGVLVNTIHCGAYNAGISGKWKHGAQMAEGEYMNINQDKAVVAIKTPQDKIIIELNEKLNRTYMWYGKSATRGGYSANQKAQDRNAMRQLGAGGLSSRTAVKGGKLYSNVGRDLVDTFNKNEKVLEEVDEDELPDELQNIPAAKRKEAVQKMAETRKEIQAKIAEANRMRLKYIADEKQKLADSPSSASTLGDAVEAAISKQMQNSGFDFGK